MIKVIIADDDPIIIEGLSMIIEADNRLKLVGTAKNGLDAVRLCREKQPDVAILDIRMPEMDGIEATVRILEEGDTSPILLTTFDEPELIDRALDAGVRGFVLKNSPVETIISAILSVSEGGTVFSPGIIDHIRLNRRNSIDVFYDDLTDREKDIVELVAAGLSNGEIAQKLYLSNGTIRNYISLILEKTGLKHRTQIAVRYYKGT